MKTVTIESYCTATVTEQWAFRVPDDFDVAAHKRDDLLDILTSSATLLDVTNTSVDDESDRQITSVKET